MLQRFLIIILISLSSAGVYDQKKVLIINNLSENVTLDSPLLKSVTVNYPKQIKPNDQGVVTIDIQKDWWIENPVDVLFKQKIFYNNAYVTLELKKRRPDPKLIDPFNPGYDCEVDTSNAKNIFNITNFNAGDIFCAAFYLY